MSDNDCPPYPPPNDGVKTPRRTIDEDLSRSFKIIDETIERAREHHARTGEWPPDPLLDEIDEIRREIMAEHDNDWRKVLKWHLEQDKLYAEQNPDAKFAKKRDASAGVSGR
jgi:hypothetical protein